MPAYITPTVTIDDHRVGYGDLLPTASTTPHEVFLLYGQTPTTLNGWYRKVNNAFWIQTTQA